MRFKAAGLPEIINPTLSLEASTLYLKLALNPKQPLCKTKTYTLNPNPETYTSRALNPKPETYTSRALNPKP